MGSPKFFRFIVTLAALGAIAWVSVRYVRQHSDSVDLKRVPGPVVYQPPPVPNPYGT
jgi:hypothetical protein